MMSNPEAIAAAVVAARDPIYSSVLPRLDRRSLARLRRVSRFFNGIVVHYVDKSKTIMFCSAHACGHIFAREGAPNGSLRCPACSAAWAAGILRLPEAVGAFAPAVGALDVVDLEEGPPAKFGQCLRPVMIAIYGQFCPLRVYLSYAWGLGGLVTRCVFPAYSLEYKVAWRLDQELAEKAQQWGRSPNGSKRRLITGRLCDLRAKIATIRVVSPGKPPWAPGYRPLLPKGQCDRPVATVQGPFTLCLETLTPPGGTQTILRFVLAKLRAQ